ncbi:helix-turn-helix transcriptional regulator [uncultured Propionibacterium sp.]|uniref:helix-turn-helix domain-containing protein n=1 Tax=uncultured Propionibacterium sp. TaxID=218066 RepID=UPI0029304A05|nr:helix-turn-helix transcriptional regulator [uncultured Propionibacterium sp.]
MGRKKSPLDQNARCHDLARWLRRQREKSNLTYRQMEMKTRSYSAATYSRADSGHYMPSYSVVAAYVDACGANKERAKQLWLAALTSSPRKTGLQIPTIDTCLYTGQLIQLMISLRLASGQPSLRKLERNANAAGKVLPKSTLADVLMGRRAPSRKILIAFVSACGMPEEEITPWVEALKRTQRSKRIQDELDRR